MATYYVDYEGAAGTGDGTSFANRASKVKNFSASLSPGDEIRIKKTPDPTSLGTGIVRHRYSFRSYSLRSVAGSNINYSTTTGQTYISNMGKGWHTGDVLHIHHADSNAGKSLSGIYKVTVGTGTEANADLYFDGYTSPDTNGSSVNFKFLPYTNVVILNTDNLTKSIACRDAYRNAWSTASPQSAVTVSYTNPSSISSWDSGPVNYTLFTGADKINVPSSVSNGLCAYYALPSTLDLSGYQQISFRFKADTTDEDTGNFSLRLCTDTAGATSVHTVPIRFDGIKSGSWISRTVDLGTNLNSAIKSIALYKDATAYSTEIDLSNIIACKADSAADSITLDKLIGLNTTADPQWCPIYAIWDNIVVLDSTPGRYHPWGYYSNHHYSYSADNDTATIYQRKQFIASDWNGSGGDLSQSDDHLWDEYDKGAGTEANPITVVGGWDRTNMSTRDGKTCVQLNTACNPFGIKTDHIHLSHMYYSHFGYFYNYYDRKGVGYTDIGLAKGYHHLYYTNHAGSFSKLGFDYTTSDRYGYVMYFKGTQQLGNIADFYVKHHAGNSRQGALIRVQNGSNFKFNKLDVINCGDIPIHAMEGGSIYVETLNCGMWDNNDKGIRMEALSSVTINNLNCYNPWSSIAYMNGGILNVNNCNFSFTLLDTVNGYFHSDGRARDFAPYSDNRNENVAFSLNDANAVATVVNYGSHYLRQIINKGLLRMDGIDYSITSGFNINSSSGRTQLRNLGGAGNHVSQFYGYTIEPETSIRHTNSGYAWKGHGNGNGGGNVELGSVVVNANAAVTIGIWTYKTTNNALATLKVADDMFMGLTGQSVNNSSASLNTWTKIEKTFTPTKSGAIQLILELTGSVSSDILYFDDLEVSQA